MEYVTVSGMKELNQKIGHIERSLDDISKSLSLIAKILNKQVPKKHEEIEEDNDEVS